MNLENVKKLYDDNARKFGTDSRSVGWPDREAQELRFELLCSVIEATDTAVSINELGCGYGELLKFLQRRDYKVDQYNGYDISEEMLARARDYLGDTAGVTFSSKDRLDQMADYSITSGIFNVRFSETDDSWKRYMEEVLENMYEHSRIGFSFNVLSTYVDFRQDHLFYADPLYFFDFCKRRFSRHVSLLHDSPLWEWTMIVKKADGKK